LGVGPDGVGPLHPVLTDGTHQFHVDGLIARGGFGHVALATVEGSGTPPKKVAIKVYPKDRLIADRQLYDAYELERRIMLDITKRDCNWLVKLRGTFGDLWNRYLIMVRDHPPSPLRNVSNSNLLFLFAGLLPKHAVRRHFR
jgi:hypothetical protein